MNLKTWWDSKTVEQRQEVADKAGIGYPYLYQLCHGCKKASTDTAKALDKATMHEVRRHYWRPDVWDAA